MTIQDWFDKYGESHQNPVNKAVHWICVPLIFATILGLLSLVPLGLGPELLPAAILPFAHLGSLLVLFGIVFFTRLSLPIAFGMALVSALLLLLVAEVNRSLGSDAWLLYLGVFVLSWIGQFIGHKIEGAKPSFLDDLKFLMIGPAWLLHFIYRKLGISY